MKARSRRRALLLLLASACLGACTFPTVDYSSAGAGGSSSSAGTGGSGAAAGAGGTPACSVPSKCSNEVWSCAKQARGNAKACENKCKPPMEAACKMSCATTLTMDLATCTGACVTCSTTEGCPMQQAACAALAAM